MPNARLPVAAPAKTPLRYGLLDVAERRTSDNPHWKIGVTWQDVCPDGAVTYDACIAQLTPGPGNAPDPKSRTALRSLWGATPFTVQVEIDCSTVDYFGKSDEIVMKAASETMGYVVEDAFSTGLSANGSVVAFPNLQGSSEIIDSTTIPAATMQLQVGELSATPLDVVEAIALLDANLSRCLKTSGMVHIPTAIAAVMASEHLIRLDEDGMPITPGGHRIVIGSGYAGNAPDGTTTPDALWVYGTGPVFYYADAGKLIGSEAQSLDRSVNTLKRIYERTFVFGYDCCLFGVPISTGGIITGSPDSET